MPNSQQPLAIDTVLKNKYRVTHLVGGGGMAWVYQVEALPVGSQSLWALKELRPLTADLQELKDARRMFDQEVQILSRLDNPHLPEIMDFFEEDGRAYLVMEFIWGESLEKRLEAANAPLLEAEVLNWAVQLCDVLHYLHGQNPPIIFRDLKPSNVMVTNTGVVKLIDFGIARTYKVGKKRDTVAMGSENYAAPEQWGKGQTDARSDIYALGATMYHLLANMSPTPSFLPTPPLPLAGYNPALSEATIKIIEKAMAEEPGERYQSALEMRQALLAALPAPYAAPVEAARAATPPPARPALPPRKCPACGKENKPEARFCTGCGHTLVGLRPAILRIVQPVRAAWEMPCKKSPMLLGRTSQPEDYVPDFDMEFYDPNGYASRRHAQITQQDEGYFITDLGSSNGTLVNGQPLSPHEPHPLHNGDRVTIGQVVIQFWLR
jgi:serine/threonine protein kinase